MCRPGVSNMRPARGSNAARQHKNLKKYETIWSVFSIWPQNSKFSCSILNARPYIESHAARESILSLRPLV